MLCADDFGNLLKEETNMANSGGTVTIHSPLSLSKLLEGKLLQWFGHMKQFYGQVIKKGRRMKMSREEIYGTTQNKIVQPDAAKHQR